MYHPVVQYVYNYIFSALYDGHLQVVTELTEQIYKMCVWGYVYGIGGWVWGTRSCCFSSGYRDLGPL